MPLTTTGAGTAQRLAQLSTPFSMGTVSSELATPFDMERPAVVTEIVTPFDMAGAVGVELVTPFDMAGLLGVLLSTPFDMVEALPTPQWGNPFNTSPAYVVLAAAASPGATVLTVNTTATLSGGQTLVLNSPETVVINVVLTATTFSVTSPLTLPHASGSLVATVTLTAPVVVGASTATVTSTATLTPGTVLVVAGESVTVSTVTSGTTFTTVSPFVAAHSSGVGLAALSGFQPFMLVFDKGGNQLGILTDYAITSPPTQAIMNFKAASAAQGSMTFTVPRTLADGQTANPEAELIFEDRLVAVGLEIGGPLWAGSIAVQESSGGVIQAECTDLFGQFVNTPSLDIDQAVSEAPAWGLIAQVLATFNLRKVADGELTWALEPSGTKPYRGAKFTVTGDMIGAIEDVVENAGVELLWRAEVVGSKLLATLIVSDRFEQIGTHAILDGPGGNVMARPRIIRDPTNVVHEITLTGQPSDLAESMPDYASWAIRNSTPKVTVSVDPGPLRRRARLDVSVPWGYSAATIASMVTATLDDVWDMYYSFLRAIHDMEGRPFHDGYTAEGVPNAFFDSRESGSVALSRKAWRTRLQLVETYPNTPASAIMLSDARCSTNLSKWLIVTHNRQTGTTTVQYWGIPDAAGASMTQWHMGDLKTSIFYTASGTRIVDRLSYTVPVGGITPGTGGFCESYNTRLYDPVAKRYRQLRRLISTPFLGKFIDPADPDISMVNLGAGAGIDTGERSQLIGKVYDFELYNIDLWDPYRDGVGTYISKPSVFNGALTTMARWHIIPYSSGASASTSLVYGISATEQDLVMETAAGWPTPESEDFPYKASIDDGLDREVIQVIGSAGLQWHVLRGQDGTTAIIHEPGAPVHRVGSTVPDGLTPLDPPWPEGEAYALELLAMMSHATVTIELDIANIDDDWRAADFGDVLPVVLSTEGIDVGFDGTARVIGRSPDPFGAGGPPGSMRVVLEVVTGG